VPDHDGRIALVTGGAAGIGAATARRLAELGATVVVADVDEEGGRKLAAQVGGAFVNLDVTSRQSWAAALTQVVVAHGSLDLLHLNAGIMLRPRDEPIGDDPLLWLDDRYDLVTAVNIDGVVYGSVAALPHLESSNGSIVVTASIAGMSSFPQDPVYALTKHAVVGYVRSLGPILAKRGVTINAVCPGGVDTAIVPPDLRGTQDFLEPEVIADAVVLAVSSDASGQIWVMRAGDREPWLYEFAPVR
jgi:NAD(P)-dependent dehydrogenase (short-subunit alcohol dehydrogenase family)